MNREQSKKLVERRHPEWREHRITWSFLQDSLEGGRRYRVANYATDGGPPVRNLIRHQRETPTPKTGNEILSGGDRAMNSSSAALEAAATSTYDLRLARTPVPSYVSEVVEKWLSRIYRKEITRAGPPTIEEWWRDVDGRESDMDEWMSDTVAPLLTVLGQIDVMCDHPPVPDGETVQDRADVIRLGLGRIRARIILPENMLWWDLDDAGNYKECLVREYYDNDCGETLERFRHWTGSESACYNPDGSPLGPLVPHPYRRPPICRVFDRRKARCGNIGLSRVESIAEKMRESYNTDSELIMSGVMTASPPLSGPADYLTGQNEVIVGPGYMLPKFNSGNGYEGWEYVTHDHSGEDSLRSNLDRRRDDVDREAGLTKPAGVSGSGQTSRQSGASKQLDAEDGNNLLAKLAKNLQKAEKRIASLALLVASDGLPNPADLDAIKITYPTGFNLYSASEQMGLIGQYQGVKEGSGGTPLADSAMLKRSIRFVLDGQPDEEFAPLDDEIERYVAGKQRLREEADEDFFGPTAEPEEGNEPPDPDDPVGRPEHPSESDGGRVDAGGLNPLAIG